MKMPRLARSGAGAPVVGSIERCETGRPPRALLVGYFCTVGDIEVLRRVQEELDGESVPYDVGPFDVELCDSFEHSVNIYVVDPDRYSHLLLVCGPMNPTFLRECRFDLDRFAHCTRIGVNLSMLRDVDDYNPFDALLGRDSNRWATPDLSFGLEVTRPPVAGICLVRGQSEYGSRGRYSEADAALRALATRAGLATIDLDTEWPQRVNRVGIPDPESFEAVVARLDVVLTTRLHGTVLALKQGVPALAVDPVAGGGKVTRQCEAIGWPEVVPIEQITDTRLEEALVRCLRAEAREDALRCAATARAAVANFGLELRAALTQVPQAIPADTTPRASPRFSRVRAVLKARTRARRLAARLAAALDSP